VYRNFVWRRFRTEGANCNTENDSRFENRVVFHNRTGRFIGIAAAKLAAERLSSRSSAEAIFGWAQICRQF
jgi:hypothetical protein